MKHSNTTPRCWRRERLRSWESLTAITPWNRWHLMLTVKKDRKLLTKFTRYVLVQLYTILWCCIILMACHYNLIGAATCWSLKFIYSEKATKFCKISTVDLFYVVPVKSTMEISQNFVAFSEYMNFINL